MKRKYLQVIYIFCGIFLISIIGGILKYSLNFIDDNPDQYILKTNFKIKNYLIHI